MFGQTIPLAAQKNQLPRPTVAQVTHPARELARGESLAVGVQQYDGRARIYFKFSERGRTAITQRDYFYFRIMFYATNVVIQKRLSFSASRLSEHHQTNFHSMLSLRAAQSQMRPNFLRFSRRVLRLIPSMSAACPIL